METIKNKRYFIDLFSGCGGLSLGLMKAGWHGLFAIEQSSDAFKTLRHNLIEEGKHNANMPRFDWPLWLEVRPYEIKDFLGSYGKRLKSLQGNIQLVAGGPPCQGFSFAGRRTGKDSRNELFQYHLQVVELVRPEFVLMENVQGIDTAFRISKQEKKARGRPRKSYAKRIRDALENQGYEVQQHILRAADFGVPQLRPRYFALGIRRDLIGGRHPPDLLKVLLERREAFLRTRGLPTDRPVTVFEAISDLSISGKSLVECKDKESPAGFVQINYKGPETSYQKLMHENMKGKQLNSLRLPRHRPETIKRFEKILKECRKGVQVSAEERARLGIRKIAITPLAPNRPSHTLTTLPDDLLHYAEPRIHTVREHARLQSFPDWFEFCGKYTTGGDRRSKECPRYTQVGNAVPPLLAEIIGEALHAILDELEISLRYRKAGSQWRRDKKTRKG